ncbi:P-loop containing nucleoside triphosphate hydrolase protein [Colletotrichum godetiae]|uniref:ATP-dependent RNA helicase SUV3, mitochondrial n=1 Tax=Colletotrichum godetiae TaxID=1209918 RepID=A0AAJ0B0E0_9PEZI|nr:P-loop containing nucleoside triphosphate hydrolase protein [Colletotrichum godetiae]KAK1700133.1 P-loop containing nucleoside triphosphate hydrolase protein [Colletotrichum godetiae]
MRSILRATKLCAAAIRPAPGHGFATSSPFAYQATHARYSTKKYAPPDRKSTKYDVFRTMILTQFNVVIENMGRWSEDNTEYRNFGIRSEYGLNNEITLFRDTIQKAIGLANKGATLRKENPLFWSLRNAFIRGDVKGLTAELRYSFQSFMLRSKLTHSTTRQRKLADLRFPMEWFPATRAMQRTIHLHVGPTNSGKTYRALQALMNSKSGIYGGPLRLLAHEIYSRFQAAGKPCAMVTGEEQRIPDADNYFISCTVEMTPLNRMVDVAVIDEIQMIGHDERGWAWTQAFLGVMAKEVHLCGEERVVDLIKSICSSIGDKCIVHRYERLSPLQTMKNSLGNDLSKLEKGDAVVAFTRVNLHGLKNAIEEATGRRCAIVYGSLPPETRAQQAALFNDPNNDYDFLVASDAIGMGLNLEIKRVIFETSMKHDGTQYRTLTTSEIKQIGGRAGRYKTARQAATKEGDNSNQVEEKKMGYVTTLAEEDLSAIAKGFNTETAPLEAAGIQPPSHIIEQFAEYFPPDTPLSFILLRLRELAPVSERFTVYVPEINAKIADTIQEFPMTIQDRITVLHAPISLREAGQADLLKAIAKCISTRSNGALCDIQSIQLELLDATLEDFNNQGRRYLHAIESLHAAITLYLWVSYRFPNVFTSQALAFHVKDAVEEKIEFYLETNAVFDPEVHTKVREKRRREAKTKEMQTELEAELRMLQEEADERGAERLADRTHSEDDSIDADQSSVPSEDVDQSSVGLEEPLVVDERDYEAGLEETEEKSKQESAF